MSKEKVGIITYHFARNYGAVLQCYALRKYLEKVGYEATVLNAISRVQEKNNSVFHKKDGIKNVVVNVVLLPFVKQRLRKEKGFADFVENYIPHTEKVVNAGQLKSWWTGNSIGPLSPAVIRCGIRISLILTRCSFSHLRRRQ